MPDGADVVALAALTFKTFSLPRLYLPAARKESGKVSNHVPYKQFVTKSVAIWLLLGMEFGSRTNNHILPSLGYLGLFGPKPHDARPHQIGVSMDRAKSRDGWWQRGGKG
jgi:hypothetical protein